MKTIKLYDSDSHIKEFSAEIIDCRKKDGIYKIILNQTAFFPEGGGQSADTGIIGGSKISNVQIINDEIIHFSDLPIKIGATVNCTIDWEQRFHRMQNHSGEHIVSGIVHTLYGYDNVGFHMGDDITVDFNGELNREQLLDIERRANEAIYKNVRFTCEYPDTESLKNLEYRSKLELTENVRIVTIDGYDICACCAPHVYTSGEIGIIKILDYSRHRGGVRIHMLCGADALKDYEIKYGNIKQIATELCSKPNDAADAFKRFFEENNGLKAEIAALKKELTQLRSSAIDNTDDCILLFEDNIQMNDLRKLVLDTSPKSSKLCAGFSGNDRSGYRFAIASQSIDLFAVSKKLTSSLNGKGGGSSELIQGSVSSSRIEIEEYFKNNF